MLCWAVTGLLLFGAVGRAAADAGDVPVGTDAVAMAQSERCLRFEIPAQPLQTALESFAERFNVQVLYRAGLVRGLRSPGIMGACSEYDALQHLLNGTGLSARFVGPHDISISLAGAPEVDLASLQPPAGTLALTPLTVQASPFDVLLYDIYARLVQVRIRSVLLSKPAESIAGQGLKIMVWVDPQGVIRRTAIVASSGDDKADAQVLKIVDGLPVLERPPAGFPQPLHVRIHVAE